MLKLKKAAGLVLAIIVTLSLSNIGFAFAEPNDPTGPDSLVAGEAATDSAISPHDDAAQQAAPQGDEASPTAAPAAAPQLADEPGAITVDPADAIEYIYLDNKVVALGQEQNIAFALTDSNAVIAQAKISLIRTGNGETESYTASAMVDNAALFSMTFDDEQDTDGYYIARITYQLAGDDAWYSADFYTLGAAIDADSYYFDVITPQLADALSAASSEDGEVTALAVTQDGDLIAADSVEEALQIAGDDPLVTSPDAAAEALAPLASSAPMDIAPLASVPPLALIVALDPGHGAEDPGASANGLVEKDLNWKIANACYTELLTYAGVNAMLTRTQNENPALQTRVDRAVAYGAQVIVSLHCNAGGGTGSEVWIPNNASYNNKTTHVVGEQLGNKILAQLNELGLKNRGVKTRDATGSETYPGGGVADYFTVINAARRAGIPAIIVEHAFLDNSFDSTLLKDNKFLASLGIADATGIAQQYGLVKNTLVSPTVMYTSHVQSIGWQEAVYNGAVAGTSGKGLRMEALTVTLLNLPVKGGIQYNAHVQSKGWQGWKSNGKIAGTTGKGLRMEALQIRLTGAMADNYDVYYRVHAQSFGWMGWAKNGASAGSMGYGLRMEALEIRLVPKGKTAPGSTATPFKSAKAADVITYQAHVQSIGWQPAVTKGATAGTTGRGLRAEALKVSLQNQQYFGDVECNAYTMGLGWRGWKSNGAISGTTGQGRAMEAVKLRLAGDIEQRYDIYYRVHVQSLGWLGWASNGDNAGTSGFGYRIEAVQIKLVKKGGAAPGSTGNAYVESAGTPIMGASKTTVAQMVRYFNAAGHPYPAATYKSKGAPTIQDFCQLVYDEATAEGVKPEVLFCQAMKETGWLQFNGVVKVGQCNFGGLGATSGTVSGATFPDVRTGLRAQVQHLKAYAVPGLKATDLKNPCVDPRFDLVTKGSAPTLEGLNGKWAVPGTTYGQDIAKMIAVLYKS